MPSPRLPLNGLRILSLALNLPGPAALMRCRALGATCTKLEPPTGDPMRLYSPQAYADLHVGVEVATTNLKTAEGQDELHSRLAQADVLLTSFRPAAMERLGLGWETLHARYPALSLVAIVGAPGAAADLPGHDLTYQAENDLLTGLNLPPTLYADMGGALMAMEAVLLAALARGTGEGQRHEVALSSAAGFLALPRAWHLTTPESVLGGAHAGYRVYACADGRVAVAALEPHFARPLCEAAGLAHLEPKALAAFFKGKTRAQLDRLAADKDLPLHTMAAEVPDR